MLPKPRNASLKETNRILLPHTLSKKPAQSKPAVNPAAKKMPPSQPASAKSKPIGLAASYDSDEEEETGTASFFSFGNTSKTEPSPLQTTDTRSETADPRQAKPLGTAAGPSQPTHKPLSISKEPTNPDRHSKLSENAPLNVLWDYLNTNPSQGCH